MTISKVFGTCMLLGLLAATALCLTPAIVFAQGGEPHSCVGFNAYDPPPYLGNVTVTFVDYCTFKGQVFIGCAFLSGEVVKAGDDNDVIHLDGLVYETGFFHWQFLSHTQNDIRGRCIIGSVMGDPYLGAYEIIGAHSLLYESDTEFTVDVVVMPLTTR
jgi:hypothetical protein